MFFGGERSRHHRVEILHDTTRESLESTGVFRCFLNTFRVWELMLLPMAELKPALAAFGTCPKRSSCPTTGSTSESNTCDTPRGHSHRKAS